MDNAVIFYLLHLIFFLILYTFFKMVIMSNTNIVKPILLLHLFNNFIYFFFLHFLHYFSLKFENLWNKVFDISLVYFAQRSYLREGKVQWH